LIESNNVKKAIKVIDDLLKAGMGDSEELESIKEKLEKKIRVTADEIDYLQEQMKELDKSKPEKTKPEEPIEDTTPSEKPPKVKDSITRLTSRKRPIVVGVLGGMAILFLIFATGEYFTMDAENVDVEMTQTEIIMEVLEEEALSVPQDDKEVKTTVEEKFEIPNPFQTYKYNTVCDLGDINKFMMEKYFVTLMELGNGNYNDNEKLIKFFKTNEFLSKINISPDQLLYPQPETPTGGLAHSPDPLSYDGVFWAPLIFDILGASPELQDWITATEGQSFESYNGRLLSDASKCK